jgi:hypothetical protein
MLKLEDRNERDRDREIDVDLKSVRALLGNRV